MVSMKTKFGNAKITNGRYYVITSRKEGNNGKLLHRLICEDFYNTEVPQGYHIHHKNGNKLDNCILNLQLMRDKDHRILHNSGENHPWYDKHHSEESKLKTSKTMNTTGYFRVDKHKDKNCKQGFYWRYSYYENGKQKRISSVDIKKLEAKVKSKGLTWKKLKSGEF